MESAAIGLYWYLKKSSTPLRKRFWRGNMLHFVLTVLFQSLHDDMWTIRPHYSSKGNHSRRSMKSSRQCVGPYIGTLWTTNIFHSKSLNSLNSRTDSAPHKKALALTALLTSYASFLHIWKNLHRYNVWRRRPRGHANSKNSFSDESVMLRNAKHVFITPTSISYCSTYRKNFFMEKGSLAIVTIFRRQILSV